MDRRSVFSKSLESDRESPDTARTAGPACIDAIEDCKDVLTKQDSSTNPITPTHPRAPTFLKAVRLALSSSRSFALKPVPPRTTHSSLCPNKMLHASLIPALKQRVRIRSGRKTGRNEEGSPSSRLGTYGMSSDSQSQRSSLQSRSHHPRTKSPQALYGMMGVKVSYRGNTQSPQRPQLRRAGVGLTLGSRSGSRSGVWASESRDRLRVEALSRVSL